MSCTDIVRDPAATPEAGALFPPSNFPAGGFGGTPRQPFPFAAPTRALQLPAREAAESPAAVQPPGRGAPPQSRFSEIVLQEIVPEPEHLAPDLAALVAVALFTAAIAVWLDALAGVAGV